jgi:membrane-bound serine protease (ClpP class)
MMTNMNPRRRVLAATLLVGGVFATGASAASAQATGPAVVGLRLEGVVDPFEASYVTSGIQAAEDEGAPAVLLTIDTPGGLDSSMREIVQAIVNSPVPVICYVSPEGARAASAGTFILISCPVAAMAPGTNVGAAHPVGVAGAVELEKATNDAVAYIRGLAQLRQRNADWAERAVREAVSVPAREALDLDVIDLIAPQTQTLLQEVDGRTVEVANGGSATLATAGVPIDQRSLGWGAAILHALLSPNLAFLFFYVGIGLIIVEVLSPGVSVPGVLGVLLLVLAFVSFGMLPVEITGLVLLVASAVSFLVELKHPGLGAASVVGVAALVFGGAFLFDRSVPGAAVSPWVIGPVAVVMVLFFATVVRAALRTRHLPTQDDNLRLLGREGVVTRRLEPTGVVHVGSESWSARSTTGMVPEGASVRVVGMEGLRLMVEPAVVTAPEGPGPEEGSST